MEGDRNLIDCGVGLGLFNGYGVEIKCVDVFNAKFVCGNGEDATSTSGIEEGLWLFLLQGYFELFKAKACREVATGSETKSGVYAEIFTMISRGLFPVRNNSQMLAYLFDFEVMLPESGPFFCT